MWTSRIKQTLPPHTTYSRNDMGQKCEGNCGLWFLNEIIKRMYPSIDYLINVEGSFLHFFWLLSLQNLDYKLISVI